MSLAAGTRVGAYSVVALIGKGGMGEVYRAHDPKLQRDVALKVLPASVAADPDRMARFEREARVLASLNHPNIAAIYGVEERALVMELVEGSSPKGPMPFDEAWKIAQQIAAALEYAHDKGVMHRDLKPANVIVTPDGIVKLLDFGLAKAFNDPMSGTAEASDAATVTLGGTVAGTILGTAAYMAPEQAKGKKTDNRADIWAFGVVLHELLTGQRLFRGEDVADTLAQVLTKEPDLTPLPFQVRRMMRECLQKDPAKRLRSIADAAKLLDDVAAAVVPAVSPPVARQNSLTYWALIGALTLGLATLAFLHFREPAPAVPPMVRSQFTLPPDLSRLGSVALSPDGKTLALWGAGQGSRLISLRDMASGEWKTLPATEGADFLFWSPDSRNIGFFAGGKLKRVAASGGPSQVIADAPSGRGGTWNRDDVILFAPNSTNGSAIMRVPVGGGTPSAVTSRTESTLHRFPLFFPDGRHFAYTASGGDASGIGIFIASLDDPKGHRILPDVSNSVLFPRVDGASLGYLLFRRESTLMAQPVDLTTYQAAGDLIPIDQPVGASAVGVVLATASANGVLSYSNSGIAGGAFSNQLAWFDRAGKELAKVGDPGSFTGFGISLDQQKLALVHRTADGNGDIFVHDLARGGVATRFTTAPNALNGTPVFSPEGGRIAFYSNRGGTADLYWKDASGTTPDESIGTGLKGYRLYDWSRDGKTLLYGVIDAKARLDLWSVTWEDKKATPFLQSEFTETEAQFSPDGKSIAYSSDESGQFEVYLRPFPAGIWKIRVSANGGSSPRWRADGGELFFWSSNSALTAVSVKPGSTPQLGAPVALFEKERFSFGADQGAVTYTVSPDGKRFLISTPFGSSTGFAQELTLLVNPAQLR